MRVTITLLISFAIILNSVEFSLQNLPALQDPKNPQNRHNFLMRGQNPQVRPQNIQTQEHIQVEPTYQPQPTVRQPMPEYLRPQPILPVHRVNRQMDLAGMMAANQQ
ncbi:uncharacterized protein LOC117173884 [Belonocnema kinseyi]|uniref:uncharacterized protein LOC117173884 n=1 Tax=Belonocnema kinseyi TaxID=2817044 RepID=UPI00143D2F87|nr:uncharacterized protein LOC117173884 [Belonocnema kinseyi]